MPIFDATSKTVILNWDQTMETPIKIKRIDTDHTENNQFINFTDQIRDTTSHLIIESEKQEKDLPGFLLKKNIFYSALPLEKELDPFLEFLSQINGSPSAAAESALSDPLRQTLDRLDIPVRLTLYIALQCPHCPAVVRTVIPLALYCSNIHLHIIDGSLFPETAQKDAVMSAPCLILEDDFRWTGGVTADEIVKMITSRDPAHLSADTLKTVLEQGDADWITRQMIEKNQIFDAFITLLIHKTWSVRLGAMVVVEALAETDPELAARICPLLIHRFPGKDIPIQGDILYALGEAGDRETMEWIKRKRIQLNHEDLMDAAEEALETLTSKIG
ncbi:thioredoxin family protein [Desulfobacula sp.]|uniref:thioredoxin family protein n=1 Tax=Desulfobacula sp. TaxID=2593537 RepID=UPI00261294B8|nr:thioredoxin family protein [Desulfobacula sp.]